MKATEQIANFIANTAYTDIPQPVLQATHTILLDGVANMLAGSRLEEYQPMLRYVKSLGGRPDCTVVGTAEKTNPLLAAFANGAAMHLLDYEPQGVPSAHGTSSLLPGLLALAEMRRAPGRAVVEAFAVGWEVQQRLVTAARNAGLLFHAPGIYGPMASAAACARLLGLEVGQVRMALGIAGSRAGSLTVNRGTHTKSTHPSHAGRMGVEAAMLAADGFTACDTVFEAPEGYVEVLFGSRFDWQALLEGLGTQWSLVRHGYNIKRYPAQIGMQWAIEAMVQLKQRNAIRAEDVDWLELEIRPGGEALGASAPATGLMGKFSNSYCAAVAMTQAEVGIDAFSDEVLFSPAMQAMFPRVRVKINPDIPKSTKLTWAVARAGLKDGRIFSERCDAYPGSARNPISREIHLLKVKDCMRRALPEPAMDRVIGLVDGLEHLADAGELARALVNSPS